MDWQSAFNLLFMAFAGACGWVLRSVHDAVQRLTGDLRSLERDLPATYARKDDINITLADIRGMLIRIEDKLDGKVDK